VDSLPPPVEEVLREAVVAPALVEDLRDADAAAVLQLAQRVARVARPEEGRLFALAGRTGRLSRSAGG